MGNNHAVLLFGLVLFCLVTGATAQDLRWRLPPLGAAEYQRQWRAQSAVADSAAAARALEPRGPVPERFLPKLLPSPWLCQGELDTGQRAVADPPRDLRDVVRAVAFDLGARGSGRWRFHRIVPFGDLSVGGRIGPPGSDGVQELQLTIDRQAPAALPGDGPETRAREVVPLCPFDAGGTLVVRRTVDVAAGVVRGFTAELQLVVEEDRRKHRKIVLRDSWRLVAVRENQDADFRKRVAAAVRNGAAWVRSVLEEGEAGYLDDKEPDRSFGSGRVALAALALLHADVPPEDPVLQSAFATLRRRKLVDTYSLGIALMAMAQRYAPPREVELVRSGQLAARRKRQLDERDQKVAAKWLARLLDNLDAKVDRAALARFCYIEGARWDNSLTQYGLLGLDAAELCGLEVPATVWQAAGNHLLAVQGPAAGRHVGLEILTHRELAAAAGGPEPRATARRTPARGFAYRGPEEPAYGGLTAAGTAGMVLARAGMLRHAAVPESLRAIDDGIDAAFAWLAAEFTVRSNPGFVGKADRHWAYWLYGLERACELSGIARLQGRDWYYEGALQLLAAQQPNGSFRAEGDSLLLDATCFSILFLKKSTVAAVTGR